MLLAKQYNLFSPEYVSNLSGLDMLLIDHTILNRVISEENKAQESLRKKQKEQRDHPGMERDESIDDFWDEAERANGED